jgi:hypothetical protein
MISDHLYQGRPAHIQPGNSVIVCRWIFLLPFLMLVAGSCKQGAGIEQEGLYGKWDIVTAKRNGKETPYLRGGYFIIEPNGLMTVNITGADERGDFSLDNNMLTLNNEKNFLIEKLHQDSLTVRYTSDTKQTFIILMTKHKDEAK